MGITGDDIKTGENIDRDTLPACGEHFGAVGSVGYQLRQDGACRVTSADPLSLSEYNQKGVQVGDWFKVASTPAGTQLNVIEAAPVEASVDIPAGGDNTLKTSFDV